MRKISIIGHVVLVLILSGIFLYADGKMKRDDHPQDFKHEVTKEMQKPEAFVPSIFI